MSPVARAGVQARRSYMNQAQRARKRARYLQRQRDKALASGMPTGDRKLVEPVSQVPMDASVTTNYDRLWKSPIGRALPYQTRMRISK